MQSSSMSSNAQQLPSPRLSIFVCYSLGVAIAGACIYYFKVRHPLQGYETAIYPMIVSTYTALLGFVIAAATIILSINTQPPKSKGDKLIRVSAQGSIEAVFEHFIRAKHTLLIGVLLGVIGIFLDRSCCPSFLRAVFYAAEIGTCLLILWNMQEVVKILSIVGRGLLKTSTDQDRKIIEANAGKTEDMKLEIPEELT